MADTTVLWLSEFNVRGNGTVRTTGISPLRIDIKTRVGGDGSGVIHLMPGDRLDVRQAASGVIESGFFIYDGGLLTVPFSTQFDSGLSITLEGNISSLGNESL